MARQLFQPLPDRVSIADVWHVAVPGPGDNPESGAAYAHPARAGLRLADRVAAARHNRFTGRSEELALFTDALRTRVPPFALLWIHGPGGTGKSMLLEEFGRLARDAGRQVATVDSRTIDPSPPGIVSALEHSGIRNPDDGMVLLIDHCEILSHLEDWFRESFLPSLPAETITVIAGRYPPSLAWRTAPGWQDLMHVHPLRNLAPDESRAYLRNRGLSALQADRALAFTHGHPLALSLVADVTERSGQPFDPVQEIDVVRALLDRFVECEPSPLHRRALEIAVHARVTSESLLADALGDQEGHAAFSWLQGLSFMEASHEGLIPHDLVRDVLETDLRWRHPERYAEVHRQVHAYLIKRIRATSGVEQQQVLHSLMFLHRNNPVWQPYHDSDQYGLTHCEPANPEDHPLILEMVRHHEGDASASIAAHWLHRQPDGFVVVRTMSGDIVGFLGKVNIDRADAEDFAADPAVAAIRAFVDSSAPVRAGEHVEVIRFAMGNDRYRNASTPINVSIMGARSVYTNPNIAWTFMAMPDPEFWTELFAYVGHVRILEAGFEVAGSQYAVFGHDWRVEPIEVFDEVLTLREISRERTLPGASQPVQPAMIVLSREEFEQSVHQALRNLHRPDLLSGNPLLYSRLLLQGNNPVRPHQLAELLRSATCSLHRNARTEKHYLALYHTYIEPEPSQERAAELLDLPFSTYRRHLTTGIKLVANALWNQDVA